MSTCELALSGTYLSFLEGYLLIYLFSSPLQLQFTVTVIPLPSVLANL